MTGIEIDGEFLDLPPGVSLEIEQNSPYLNNEVIYGDYSLPITIPYTDKNFRMLSYTGQHHLQHEKITVEARLHASAGSVFIGTLVIDGYERNANVNGSILTKAIFTFALSSFFQSIKGKKLSDLQLGGIRTFSWTGFSPYDGSGGFWQHAHATFGSPATYDYTFPPIKNDEYGYYFGNDGSPAFKNIYWMNKLQTGHSQPYLEQELNIASLCPAVKISYILNCIFTEMGWDLEGEVIDDTTFQKLYMQSFRGIYWCDYTAVGLLSVVTKGSVDVDLREHMPPDYTIQSFIIDLKNRYGIAFVFDKDRQKCTLKFMKNIANNGNPKDLTKWAHAQVKTKFSIPKIITLENVIDSEDNFPVPLTNTDIPTTPAVMGKDDLLDPNTTPLDEGVYCFVRKENTWYITATNPDATALEWLRAGDNIGDVIIPDANESFKTEMSTLATGWVEYRLNFYGQIPVCQQNGNWHQNLKLTPWKPRIILYHGLQYDQYVDYTDTGKQLYPMAGSHNLDNYGNDLGGWSNVYEFNDGTKETGLKAYLWDDWIAFYNKVDLRTYTFNLPLYQFYDLKWEDIINIHSAKFIIKQMRYTIPYSGTVEMELLKIY